MRSDRCHRTECLAAGAALLTTGALAAPAAAAQIALNRSCYLNAPREAAQVKIEGRGFAPASTVAIGGDVVGTAATDAAGSFVTSVRAPDDTTKPGARRFTVTASAVDPATSETISASTTGHYSQAGLALSANVVGFDQRITYYFGGFRPGRQIFGHYFIGRRPTGRKRFGKATGPCGTLRAKAKGYPISDAQPAKWTVFYDDVKTFSKHAIPTYVYLFHKL